MRQNLIAILLFSSLISFGQKSAKWRLSFQLQPELTFHKNQYYFKSQEQFTKVSFNVGAASLIQYNLTARIFIEGGLGFISRKLATRAFVAQLSLPKPYYDTALVLYVTRHISLRTLQFPVGIGVTITKTTKAKLFVKAGYVPNFLLNAKYDVNNYPAFKKNYWQGYSLNAGIGMDYQLNRKISFTSALAYSFTNTVTKDRYLFSQDERSIALPHTYLQYNTGIKMYLY